MSVLPRMLPLVEEKPQLQLLELINKVRDRVDKDYEGIQEQMKDLLPTIPEEQLTAWKALQVFLVELTDDTTDHLQRLKEIEEML